MNARPMNDASSSSSALSQTSIGAAVLLLVLCVLTLASGVSQQSYEWVATPEVYAAGLVRDGAWLRRIIGIDDVFIAAYVAASLLLSGWLVRARPELSSIGWTVAILGTAAGVLDLEENHHLLAMLRLAELDVPLPLSEILARSDRSQLKWMLGHVAFALAGVVLPARTPLAKLVRLSLVAVQLPLGAAVWACDAPALLPILVWARYGALLSGFVLLPRLVAPSAAAGRDAPAAVPAVT